MAKEDLKNISERLERIEKASEEKKEAAKKEFPFVKDLNAIVILGRGQTLGMCPETKPEGIEYWGCNNVYRARKLDRLFVISDVYKVQYEREKKLVNEINQHEFPVYTLGDYPEFKNNARYPMQEVLDEYSKYGEGASYILNTAAYMMALAILLNPKKLILSGVDMEYGTNTEYMYNEKACIESWLGMALGRGIEYGIADGSTLLKRKTTKNWYGYKANQDNADRTLRLEPLWGFGDATGKCPIRYKLTKIHHNL